MRTRSGREVLDPLSPLPPSNVQPPRQRRTPRAAPPPPPPPLPAGIRTQQQARQETTHPAPRQPQGAVPRANAGVQARVVGERQPPPPIAHPDETPHDWVLRVQIRRDDGRPLTKVGIHVTGHMNATALAACLTQACTSVDRAAVAPQPIAGLFIERNGLFVSLEHLLDTPSLRSNTFGFSYHPPPPQPPPPTPWYMEPWVWIALSGPVVIGVLQKAFSWYGPEIYMGLVWMTSAFFDATVQLPLQELYRYGPWFIGWEGASLASICSRITYYGDTAFWRRNIEECEGIYQAKEEAFLRVARPSLYAVLAIIILWALKQVLQHFLQMARYRHHRAASTAPPPEMVDTYRAFQVLLRQVRKGLEQPSAPAQPPAARGARDASSRTGSNNSSFFR